jgi:16S rRNA C967 or C1407 C5-methylase (RsmB/RsmF family)
MTTVDIRALLNEVSFRDWRFAVYQDVDSTPILRVVFDAPCTTTGVRTVQYGRKWRLSKHMTRTEIVSTAWKAVFSAVEHEAREEFRYRGRAVFGPHIDVDALHEIADHADVRTKVGA